MVGGHCPTSLSDVCSTIALKETLVCGNKGDSHTRLDFLSITPTLPLGWLKSASEDCGLLERKNNSKQELRQQPVAGGHWFKALQQCSVSSVCSYNASLLLSNHVGLCVFQRGHLNQAKTSPGTVMKQAFLNICQALMGPKVLPCVTGGKGSVWLERTQDFKETCAVTSICNYSATRQSFNHTERKYTETSQTA